MRARSGGKWVVIIDTRAARRSSSSVIYAFYFMIFVYAFVCGVWNVIECANVLAAWVDVSVCVCVMGVCECNVMNVCMWMRMVFMYTYTSYVFAQSVQWFALCARVRL